MKKVLIKVKHNKDLAAQVKYLKLKEPDTNKA